MPSEQFDARSKGLVLTTAGGLALSFDIPLVRLADGDIWPVLALRNLSTFALAFAILLILRRVGDGRVPFRLSIRSLAASALYGLSTMAFIAAVYHTTTANLVFIVAFNPMFGALLSWFFLKERPSSATLATMAIMVCGVALIVGDGMAAGHLFGDLLALACGFLIAAALTIGRASKEPMGFAPLMGTLLPGMAGLVMASQTGFAIGDPQWVLLDGAVMMPLAFWCLATGPRYLPAAEVGMFYLLETILAPIWMWLIFTEAPSGMTLVGGTIMLLGLIGNSLLQVWLSRRVQPEPGV